MREITRVKRVYLDLNSNTWHLVMDYAEMGSLQDMVEKEGLLKEKQAMDIMR